MTTAEGEVGPVPLRPEVAAILKKASCALAAIQIDGGAWWTVFLAQFAIARASFGIPLAVIVAVSTCAAIFVELRGRAR
jgi:hypothetical protein